MVSCRTYQTRLFKHSDISRKRISEGRVFEPFEFESRIAFEKRNATVLLCYGKHFSRILKCEKFSTSTWPDDLRHTRDGARAVCNGVTNCAPTSRVHVFACVQGRGVQMRNWMWMGIWIIFMKFTLCTYQLVSSTKLHMNSVTNLQFGLGGTEKCGTFEGEFEAQLEDEFVRHWGHK